MVSILTVKTYVCIYHAIRCRVTKGLQEITCKKCSNTAVNRKTVPLLKIFEVEATQINLINISIVTMLWHSHIDWIHYNKHLVRKLHPCIYTVFTLISSAPPLPLLAPCPRFETCTSCSSILLQPYHNTHKYRTNTKQHTKSKSIIMWRMCTRA